MAIVARAVKTPYRLESLQDGLQGAHLHISPIVESRMFFDLRDDR